MLIVSCVILILHILHISDAAKKIDNTSLWNWECLNEKCVPCKNYKQKNVKPQSLETCNRLCSIQIWPQPTGQVNLAKTAIPTRADLMHLEIVSLPSDTIRPYIQDAFQLMRNDLKIMERKKYGFVEWRGVELRVSLNGSADPRMTLNTDESYELLLQFKKEPGGSLVAFINAQSFCGIRHAFETLTQLIWFDPYVGTLMILEAASIEDGPKFSYRGLLIDTARSYYPVTDLLRTIDAMGACKLNTLHWHASDSQSFSIRFDSAPQLSLHGAYSSAAVYLRDEVLAVVRHAKLRGIRVIIEINTPSHVGRAWEWDEAVRMDSLVFCNNRDNWSAYCDEPPCGQLNPSNPLVYDILERIYSEIIQLTEVEDIFHLGGYEISNLCWEEQNNNTDAILLWTNFTLSALQRLEYANGKLPNLILLWTSHLSDLVKIHLKEYVHLVGFQSREVTWAKKYINGFRTVISHEDAWDFNSGMGLWFEESGGARYNSWQRVYEYRPWARRLDWWVEGGEATVWSSTLSSGGLEPRVWPRGAALAERLWSDRVESASKSVHARLDVMRSRLIDRGIKATPLWSLWCTHNTKSCF